MSQLGQPVRTGRQQQNTDEYDEGSFTFRPATKEQAKARIALQGVSGSGKTWTSLALANGLSGGKRFAVIDTERGAASKYVGINGIQFDVLQMQRFDPRDLVKALAAAAQAGYPVVLVDSLSHYWKGTDGALDQVEKHKGKYGNNSFAGWKDVTPMQNDMIDALLSYPGHVVVTMRSHTEWVLQENERGRKEPVAMGMRAEQRKGVEYEFDVVGAMDITNTLKILKSRCPALHNQTLERPDGDTDIAKPLLEWLNDGAEPIDPTAWVDAATAADATADSLLATYREAEAHGALATPFLHPASGEPTNLGDFIKERGTALKNAA
ncbi:MULTISPECIES: ATP-binding protein [unclassified Streptomyces]|uniref:ATP-binding protein n=1 Tax=unclassified Streptomyces TaxID=2593676 RepID=UPI00136D52F7|nr:MULTISPECIES: ATP-binding protein [unclassified Streptomyces]NEA03696.1 AAA family ATPase [Streptomyces sp. SID10116]MYY79698.1 AAA family ATPase [Streptomyces sp. SID335]MYZ12828.1 AAA family ATPase [Streptomyces sp. SID337]NDZ91132.1 AAA family ATPase [Streptomyces sp. SID10115]NEB43529.1 AAA family ATPase [Streptomyces sp. SID339]